MQRMKIQRKAQQGSLETYKLLKTKDKGKILKETMEIQHTGERQKIVLMSHWKLWRPEDNRASLMC